MTTKNVWASHRLMQASWVDYPEATGYDHVFYFSSLTDLCGQMARKDLLAKVQVLGLAAHGPEFKTGGVINLDRPLTPESIRGFDHEFEVLGRYLTRSATLVFYSCVAGYSGAGSALLIEISWRLRGRTIIGFTEFGITDPRGESNPGIMSYTPTRNPNEPAGLLMPGGAVSKWARDGQIIRLPADEVPVQGAALGARAGRP